MTPNKCIERERPRHRVTVKDGRGDLKQNECNSWQPYPKQEGGAE